MKMGIFAELCAVSPDFTVLRIVMILSQTASGKTKFESMCFNL